MGRIGLVAICFLVTSCAAPQASMFENPSMAGDSINWAECNYNLDRFASYTTNYYMDMDSYARQMRSLDKCVSPPGR